MPLAGCSGLSPSELWRVRPLVGFLVHVFFLATAPQPGVLGTLPTKLQKCGVQTTKEYKILPSVCKCCFDAPEGWMGAYPCPKGALQLGNVPLFSSAFQCRKRRGVCWGIFNTATGSIHTHVRLRKPRNTRTGEVKEASAAGTPRPRAEMPPVLWRSHRRHVKCKGPAGPCCMHILLFHVGNELLSMRKRPGRLQGAGCDGL